MQTLGGDHQGDVWLYDMGKKDYERLKTYSELQRAVHSREAWLVERLLKEGGARYNQIGGLESDLSLTLIPSTGGGLDEDEDGDLRADPGDVDIEVRDEEGRTPLMVAAIGKDTDTLGVLTRYGADCDAVDDYGLTALMRASAAGNLEVVEMLLDAGAGPDRVNELDGRQTACMMACAQGRKDVVEALVRKPSTLCITEPLLNAMCRFSPCSRAHVPGPLHIGMQVCLRSSVAIRRISSPGLWVFGGS